MSAQHTPGRISQGRTLVTRLTEKWTPEQWDQNEAREKCQVFAGFSSADEGRGRTLVAEVRTGPEDARRLAACWNACIEYDTEVLECASLHESAYAAEGREFELTRQRDALLEALKALIEGYENTEHTGLMDIQVCGSDIIKAYAAIAKVTGEPT